MTSESSLLASPTLSSGPFSTTSRSPSSSNLLKSLEDIRKSLENVDNFLTLTEDIMRQEKFRDFELYQRERAKKKGKNFETTSVAPPLSFKNGKIICLGDDGTKFNPANVQLTHEIVKQIINNQNNFLCFDSQFSIRDDEEDEPPPVIKMPSPPPIPKTSAFMRTNTLDVKISEEDEIFLVHQEEDNFMKLNSMNDRRLIEFSPSSSSSAASSKVEGSKVMRDFEEELKKFDFDRSETLECITAPEAESPEKSQKTQTTTLSRESSASDRPLTSKRLIKRSFRRLIGKFNDRAKRIRHRIEITPPPSANGSAPTTPEHKRILFGKKNDDDDDVVVIENEQDAASGGKPDKSLAGKQHKRLSIDGPAAIQSESKSGGHRACSIFCCCPGPVLDPQGKFYISWLFIVTLSFIYNAFVIPLRTSFPFQTSENYKSWFVADVIADIIYLIDLLFIKHRTMYLYEGFWIRDPQLTRKNYMRKLQFKMDVISLLPLDFLYLHPFFGFNAVYLRIPRLFKIQTYWEFFKLLDRMIASPHMLRVGKTLSYMLYMIHLTACTYYAVSKYKGLGSNRWVFSGKGHPYVRCFAFATKTATSIGKNPKPYETDEYLFMTCAWLMGVFVFALLIGQIRDIIATATRSQSEYKQLVDETLEYLRRLNLPAEVLQRVKQWFTFTWEQQRSLDETHILDALPANLKTDIAISVHIQTLSKVQLFAGCDEAFLRELVLKLRSVIFLPNDYVCQKGEVGKEMYIIKTGQVQVLSQNDEVLATLCTGAWFGEISLLDIGGVNGNRRTADVRSKGFSNLFVLSKSDLQEVIVHYEDARAALENRAKTLLKENATRDKREASKKCVRSSDSSLFNSSDDDVIISHPRTPKDAPKLLDAVIQALPQNSPAAQLLTRGSRKKKRVGPAPAELNHENEKSRRESESAAVATSSNDRNEEDFGKCHKMEDSLMTTWCGEPESSMELEIISENDVDT